MCSISASSIGSPRGLTGCVVEIWFCVFYCCCKLQLTATDWVVCVVLCIKWCNHSALQWFPEMKTHLSVWVGNEQGCGLGSLTTSLKMVCVCVCVLRITVGSLDQHFKFVRQVTQAVIIEIYQMDWNKLFSSVDTFLYVNNRTFLMVFSFSASWNSDHLYLKKDISCHLLEVVKCFSRNVGSHQHQTEWLDCSISRLHPWDVSVVNGILTI